MFLSIVSKEDVKTSSEKLKAREDEIDVENLERVRSFDSD